MKSGWKVSWGEFAAIFVIFVVLAGVLLPSLSRSREASRRASCQNNLKQMGLVCKMFANESAGERWPPLSRIPNNWIFDMNHVYPEYLTDLQILICPDSPFAPHVEWTAPECVTSLFYNYTGWLLQNDEQAFALFETYYTMPDAVIDGSTLKVSTPVWAGFDQSGRDAEGSMAVVWDRVPLTDREFSHAEPGVNVLIMDGHVEWVPYSYYNKSRFFPVTRMAAETFGSVLPTPSSACAN